MAKRRLITDWQISELFGAQVIRGRIDGLPITVPLLWRTGWWREDVAIQNPPLRFGVSWNGRSTNEVLAGGQPHADPYPLLPELPASSAADSAAVFMSLSVREARMRVKEGRAA